MAFHKRTCRFLQYLGEIDGSHIPILIPKDNRLDYYKKRTSFYCIAALVDPEYKFMNIHEGWPGSCHDACIIANSTVFAKGEAGDLIPDRKQCIAGVNVPIYCCP